MNDDELIKVYDENGENVFEYIDERDGRPRSLADKLDAYLIRHKMMNGVGDKYKPFTIQRED